MKMQQIVVVKNNIKKVRWANTSPKIKVGNKIRFKDEKGTWDILLVFSPSINKIN